VLYRFHQFTIDNEQCCILVKGKLVAVDARIVRLLSLLVTHYPKACSQDQVLKAIWPTTVVSEWSVSRLVADCRRFFKQHGYGGQVIQTLRGEGYRLDPALFADIKKVDQAQNGAETESVRPQKIQDKGLVLRAALLLLISVPLIGYLSHAYFQQRAPTAGLPLIIGENADARGRVLWIDDNPSNNLLEKAYLEQQGIAVYTVDNSKDALTLLSLYNYQAIISDMGRDDDPLAGVRLLETFRAKNKHTPFFIYSIMPSPQKQQLIADIGGQGVATQPSELYEMLAKVFNTPASTPTEATQTAQKN